MVIRAILSITALLVIYVDATEPSLYPAFAYGVLVSYVAYSLVLLLALRRGPSLPRNMAIAIEAVDLLIAVVLTLLTEGPNSPFFALFGFVLLAAAYRWGLRETVLTAAASILLFVVEALLLTKTSFPRLAFDGEFTLNRFLMRCAYLSLLAIMIGYLAEEEKAGRAELALIARTLPRAQEAGQFTATLRAIAREMLSIFEADSICLVTEERPHGRSFLWRATFAGPAPAAADRLTLDDRARPEREDVIVHMREIAAPARDRYRIPDGTCGIVSGDGHGGFHFQAADEDGQLLNAAPTPLPAAFLDGAPFTQVLAVSQTVSEDWHTRVFLSDPRVSRRSERTVGLFRLLSTQLAPIAYSAYLIGRLRSRAVAADRARVARELHDSVIQSLIGIQMRLEALKIGSPSTFEIAPDLVRVEEALAREVVNLRMLMFELTRERTQPRELQRALIEVLDQFEHASGITARFIGGDGAAPVSARVCHEMSRILHEALVNVQKHSRAQNVVVTLNSEGGEWILRIEDDGWGFPRSTTSAGDSSRAQRSPRVIRERVESLGGSLVVLSIPDRGSRLEITVPRQG